MHAARNDGACDSSSQENDAGELIDPDVITDDPFSILFEVFEEIAGFGLVYLILEQFHFGLAFHIGLAGQYEDLYFL